MPGPTATASRILEPPKLLLDRLRQRLERPDVAIAAILDCRCRQDPTMESCQMGQKVVAGVEAQKSKTAQNMLTPHEAPRGNCELSTLAQERTS